VDIEQIRTYCLSLPLVTEDSPYGPDWVVFRIYEKIFAMLDLNRPDLVVLKCDADYATALRDKYRSVQPAWHCNKRYWNDVRFNDDVPDDLVEKLVRHSLDEVVKEFPKRKQEAYARILSRAATC